MSKTGTDFIPKSEIEKNLRPKSRPKCAAADETQSLQPRIDSVIPILRPHYTVLYSSAYIKVGLVSNKKSDYGPA